MLLPQVTIKYKTYVKKAMVEAFRGVFSNHKDALLARTFVTLDYPRSNTELPCVIVRLHERDIRNMGVGHEEHIHLDGPNGEPEGTGIYKFGHSLYHAEIEYEILALSSLDRDYISDTIVQTIMMGKLEGYTNAFFERIYPDERQEKYPDSIWHTITINSDIVTGGGESQAPTPWESEDDLLYKTSYRSEAMGEFYSVPPDLPKGYITDVLLLPYIAGLEEIPKSESGQVVWEPELEVGEES